MSVFYWIEKENMEKLCLANMAKLYNLYKAEKKNGSKNNPTLLWHLDKFEKCNKICYPQEYCFF